VIVTLYDEQEDMPIDHDRIKPLVQNVLSDLEYECDEVIIQFVSREKICELHEQFFDDPSLTDCITFPYDPVDDESGYSVLGEVFVCPYTALTYSKENQLDPRNELNLYIIHGLLHLMGYNDIQEEEKFVMRSEEKRLMNRWG